ncbi:hypothetical protein, partial [Rhizobium mesosinicum]|uniref:hypothetical protein n=1 Tax=Rhizobium mesosinicum TaxID=335017 RepID=UPI001C6EA072
VPGGWGPASHLFSARCRGVNLDAVNNVFPITAGKMLLAFCRSGFTSVSAWAFEEPGVPPGLQADQCAVLQVLSCGIGRWPELHSHESKAGKERLPAAGTDLGRGGFYMACQETDSSVKYGENVKHQRYRVELINYRFHSGQRLTNASSSATLPE